MPFKRNVLVDDFLRIDIALAFNSACVCGHLCVLYFVFPAKDALKKLVDFASISLPNLQIRSVYSPSQIGFECLKLPFVVIVVFMEQVFQLFCTTQLIYTVFVGRFLLVKYISVVSLERQHLVVVLVEDVADQNFRQCYRTKNCPHIKRLVHPLFCKVLQFHVAPVLSTATSLAEWEMGDQVTQFRLKHEPSAE